MKHIKIGTAVLFCLLVICLCPFPEHGCPMVQDAPVSASSAAYFTDINVLFEETNDNEEDDDDEDSEWRSAENGDMDHAVPDRLSKNEHWYEKDWVKEDWAAD